LVVADRSVISYSVQQNKTIRSRPAVHLFLLFTAVTYLLIHVVDWESASFIGGSRETARIEARFESRLEQTGQRR